MNQPLQKRAGQNNRPWSPMYQTKAGYSTPPFALKPGGQDNPLYHGVKGALRLISWQGPRGVLTAGFNATANNVEWEVYLVRDNSDEVLLGSGAFTLFDNADVGADLAGIGSFCLAEDEGLVVRCPGPGDPTLGGNSVEQVAFFHDLIEPGIKNLRIPLSTTKQEIKPPPGKAWQLLPNYSYGGAAVVTPTTAINMLNYDTVAHTLEVFFADGFKLYDDSGVAGGVLQVLQFGHIITPESPLLVSLAEAVVTKVPVLAFTVVELDLPAVV